MNKIDYKEKYEQAPERCKEEFNFNNLAYSHEEIKQKLKRVFPEIKESEDERIRKSIIDLIEKQMPKSENKKWMIAWLENKSKQKPVISDDALREGIAHFGITQYQITNWLKKYIDVKKQSEQKANEIHPIFRVGDYIKNKNTSDKVLIEQLDVKSKAYYYTSYDGAAEIHSDFSFSKQDEWELIGQLIVEQKPTDKAEPKFKVGDWIVQEGVGTYKIIEVCGWYEVIGIDGNQYSISFLWENDCRLWTIQDAKDGDVLVSESKCGLNTWYCIFKSLDDDESMTVHCYIGRDGRFQAMEELCFNKDPRDVKPATKEQRDLLFSKMKEAGYEWNSEKKELKKIEQKPAFCHHEVDLSGCSEEYRKAYYDGWNNCNQQHSQLKAEQKPAWSENDELNFNQAIYVCHQYEYFGVEIWLKSLKKRMKGE